MKRLPVLALSMTLSTILAASEALASQPSEAAGPPAFPTILFGAAYYEEYSPTDRLDEDVRMMKARRVSLSSALRSPPGARLNRRKECSTSATSIAFSTPWTRPVSRSSWARRLTRFLHGLRESIRTFLPSLLAGPGVRHVARTWTSPTQLRQAAERVIVALIDHVKDHPSSSAIRLTTRPNLTTRAGRTCRPPSWSGCVHASPTSPI